MKFLLCEHLLVCLYIICFSQIPSNKSSLYLHCSWVHESLQSVSPSTLCLIPSLSVILPFRLEWCTSDSPLDHPIPYKSTSPPFTTCVTLSNVPFFLKSLWIWLFFLIGIVWFIQVPLSVHIILSCPLSAISPFMSETIQEAPNKSLKKCNLGFTGSHNLKENSKEEKRVRSL